MALFLVTGPPAAPVSLADAKAHLKVDDAADDALIEGLIDAAREYVETFTHRAIMTQTWDLKLDEFPCSSEAIEIPMPPAVSVTSVTYIATDGTSTVWSSALYTTDLPAGPHARKGRIYPIYATYYPVTRSVPNAVTVRFVAGYGATAATCAVPASIIAAMKILIGTWYGPGRESVNIGNLVSEIPSTVNALLWPFKSF